MKKNLIFLFVIFIIAACKNEEQQATEMPETAAPIDHEQAVQPGDVGDMDDIQLDQGEPWVVKQEISERIDNISQLVSNYSLQAAEDYQNLGKKLQKEQEELEKVLETNADYSRDLQVYLKSLGQKIDRLQQVNSVQEGERLLSEVKKQLQLYSSYFS